MNKSIKLAAAGLMSLCATQSFAADGDIDISQIQGALQAEAQGIFDALVEDLGSAMSYKSVAPAEPLGITGFDIGLVLSATEMANAGDWDILVQGGDSMSTLPLAKVYLQKGLPFGIDIGAFYMGASATNVKLVGAEVKYAFLKGGAVTPAVAARLSLSKLSGVTDFDFSSKSLDVSISKGFANLTPYAGVGVVQTSGEYTGSVDFGGGPIKLDAHEPQQTKTFAGININLLAFDLGLDWDKTGDSNTYSLKFGFRF